MIAFLIIIPCQFLFINYLLFVFSLKNGEYNDGKDQQYLTDRTRYIFTVGSCNDQKNNDCGDDPMHVVFNCQSSKTPPIPPFPRSFSCF